jgi:hypothetical protein
MKSLGKEWIGSTVSEGTNRAEDLIPQFMQLIAMHDMLKANDLIDMVKVEHPEVDITHTESMNHYVENTDDDITWIDCMLWEDLFDYMSEIAPEGCYFGSHYGDGACYGFWLDEEKERD